MVGGVTVVLVAGTTVVAGGAVVEGATVVVGGAAVVGGASVVGTGTSPRRYGHAHERSECDQRKSDSCFAVHAALRDECARQA